MEIETKAEGACKEEIIEPKLERCPQRSKIQRRDQGSIAITHTCHKAATCKGSGFSIQSKATLRASPPRQGLASL
eukprot:568778-Pelagomonas_calceolata.AAC.1